MIEFLQQAANYLVLIFVLTSMLNVGLTQKPTNILKHLKNKQFLITMLITNLIVVPALMVFAVQLFPLAWYYEAGLILFGLAAGAPFLIHLTKTSKRDLALGATVMMVLILGSVVTMPLIVPRILDGVTVNPWQIVATMLIQLILPMIIGMILTQVAEPFAAMIQPAVARISNIVIYLLLAAVLIGYWEALLDPEIWIAIVVGLAVILLSFFIGYLIVDGPDELKDVGALGTAQRGTIAAMIVGANAFDDPRVIVFLTLLNNVGIFVLSFAAKWLSKDARFRIFTPVAADPPQRHPAARSGATSSGKSLGGDGVNGPSSSE